MIVGHIEIETVNGVDVVVGLIVTEIVLATVAVVNLVEASASRQLPNAHPKVLVFGFKTANAREEGKFSCFRALRAVRSQEFDTNFIATPPHDARLSRHFFLDDVKGELERNVGATGYLKLGSSF